MILKIKLHTFYYLISADDSQLKQTGIKADDKKSNSRDKSDNQRKKARSRSISGYRPKQTWLKYFNIRQI